MRTRVLVGLAFVPLLVYILFLSPFWALPLTVSIASAVAVWELLSAGGYVKKRRLVIYGACFSVLFSLYACCVVDTGFLSRFNLPFFFNASCLLNLSAAGLIVYTALLFAEALFDHKCVRFDTVSVIFTVSVFVPLMLTSFTRLLYFDNGKYFIALPIIAACFSDTFAYFTGKFLGKHKLSPTISPKKTVEGSIGGLLGAAVFTLLYGLILQVFFYVPVFYPYLLLYGFLGSAAAQFGDLSMSLIKRERGIKDFGNIIPGHGGVTDRLDSILFAAPMIEMLVFLFPAL